MTSNPPNGSEGKAASANKRWLRAIELTAQIEAEPQRLFADLIDEWAERSPAQACLVSDRESFTYRELAERIHRYARWALAEDLAVGDCVALLMPNRPEYLAAWLGLSRVGVVVALINTNLVGPSLAHCINVSRAKHVIVAAGLREAFEGAAPLLAGRPTLRLHGSGDKADLTEALAGYDVGPLSAAERRAVTTEHRALMIYTSGTTGLPKAANVTHRRVLTWGRWFEGLMDATAADRLYDCLPLYHSVGGVAAPCSMLSAGASVVISEKFSASRFWHDIARWDCSIFQYIGELCRFLLKSPEAEAERTHGLRLACGNGLAGDIWEAFQSRFTIPRILEFYAATEGNFSLYNVEGKPGAIGRIPPFLKHRFPAAIIRLDADGTPLRTAEGWCVPCAPDEAGEAIGRIGTKEQRGGQFEGYTDAAETDKKILRDVFTQGDAWFRTGDLMQVDRAGYFRFVDRSGDTFRWKGENVATSEVNAVLLASAGVTDAVTYGVTIPGADGRAGMAAIVVGDGFDIAAMYRHMEGRLPSYAQPVLIRIRTTLDVTETFKPKRAQLVSDGFDPAAVSDRLFYRDAAAATYRPLDAAKFAGIVDGTLRL
ncbi:long-chain-acyl-CoA synthetase [Bradyrhizobium jicamae]|uniref:long-chain-acyl-CoA synthetase n=1 Tax=Bradyrhizobium jicamae TaxID=280332 RepID=UPI001BAA5D1D|nr:long-chain-acyl-CoA synthetase [Bradyrhizobium jicamae]MBR0938586.1 long-chain-acyl-CoA synthetase [Bradyrhizobium jicamae]